MKRTILYATMSAMFLIFSCQKDNTQEDSVSVSAIQKENWLAADLDSKFANSQKQVTAYLFDNDEMSKLVKTSNINEVRFVLGYSDNTIQIDVVGVDKSGKKLGSVKSKILNEQNYTKKLNELNDVSVSTTNKRTALLITDTYLAINDYIFIPPLSTVSFIVNVADTLENDNIQINKLIRNIALVKRLYYTKRE